MSCVIWLRKSSEMRRPTCLAHSACFDWQSLGFEEGDARVSATSFARTSIAARKEEDVVLFDEGDARVSIPAPAYYAHLVAIRARYHIIDKEHDVESTAFETNDESRFIGIEKAVQVHEASKNVMYFA